MSEPTMPAAVVDGQMGGGTRHLWHCFMCRGQTGGGSEESAAAAERAATRHVRIFHPGQAVLPPLFKTESQPVSYADASETMRRYAANYLDFLL